MSLDAGSPEHPSAGGSIAAASATPPSAPQGSFAEQAPRERQWLVAALARGFALFFGAFTMVNVVGSVRHDNLDLNIWWVAVPLVGRLGSAALLAVMAAALLTYAIAPRLRPWRRWATLALCLGFAAITAWNGVQFYLEWRAGRIKPGVPIPLSFVLCAVLVFIAWAALRPPAPRHRHWTAAAVVAATAAGCALVFPIAQVFFFGTTDYRRPADVVVIFGAQVHDDGRPSTALRDRVDTGVELYKAGLVKHVFVSGGVGDSGYNEALVMRDMAIERGVPARDIAVDSNGVSTDATVDDTVPFFGDDGWRTVMTVSQFFHLPRVKLAYQSAGWDVLTVPARTSTPIPQTPRLVVREIPAFWLYYVRAVLR